MVVVVVVVVVVTVVVVVPVVLESCYLRFLYHVTSRERLQTVEHVLEMKHPEIVKLTLNA